MLATNFTLLFLCRVGSASISPIVTSGSSNDQESTGGSTPAKAVMAPVKDCKDEEVGKHHTRNVVGHLRKRHLSVSTSLLKISKYCHMPYEIRNLS